MDNFGFDELQADAIVKLQLGRLAGLEILKIEQELGELRAAIADYEDILANDEHVKNIVKTDLTRWPTSTATSAAPPSRLSPARSTSRT